MKTITEFSGFVLKEAVAKKAALITEGKTEEEAQGAINEQLKLDETKVPFYKNALDMTNSRLDQVKRVVVALKATETEKVPTEFAEREGHFYLVEYFGAASRTPSYESRDERGGRGGRGGKGNDRGRGGNDRGRGGAGGPGGDRGRAGPGSGFGGGGDRPRIGPGGGGNDRPRREFSDAPPVVRPSGTFAARDPNAPAPAPRAPREPRAPRPPKDRAPRAPRENREPRAPQGGPKGAGELRLILKGQTQTTLQGSGIDEVPASVIAPDTAASTTSDTPQA